MFSRHPSTPSLNTELLSQPFSASRAHPNLISSATSSHFFLGCHMNSNDYKEGLEIVQTINQHYQRTWPRQNVKVVVCYIHPFMCKASKKILTFCLLPTVSLIYRVSHALSEKRIDADISKCCRIRHWNRNGACQRRHRTLISVPPLHVSLWATYLSCSSVHWCILPRTRTVSLLPDSWRYFWYSCRQCSRRLSMDRSPRLVFIISKVNHSSSNMTLQLSLGSLEMRSWMK